MKKAYLERMKQKRKDDSEDEELSTLPPKKRGRPTLLGDYDKQLELYLRKVRQQGGVITASVVVAAARGILLTSDRSQLDEFGGHITLTRQWAYNFLKRMKFVRKKATTSKSKHKPTDFDALKKSFLEDVKSTVVMEEIPPELILNWDQTGIHLVPASSWTMEKVGSKRVEITGVNDKKQITAVFCGSLSGDFLPIQLIYQGKTARCHPNFSFPSDWNITHSPKHWSTEETMVQYIENIIVPYVERTRENFGADQSALVIMDNFKGQVTPKINRLLEDNNIHACLLPANTTDLLQPMDISVNKPAKDFLKRKLEQWYSDEVMKQLKGVTDIESAEIEPINISFSAMKVLTAKWLVEMGDFLASNPQFIVNGYMRAGIAGILDGYDDSSSADGDEEPEDPLSEESSSSNDDEEPEDPYEDEEPEDPFLEEPEGDLWGNSEDEVMGSFSDSDSS